MARFEVAGKDGKEAVIIGPAAPWAPNSTKWALCVPYTWDLHLTADNGCDVSATRLSGRPGQSGTLTPIPLPHYVFTGYQTNDTVDITGNNYKFKDEDAYITACFSALPYYEGDLIFYANGNIDSTYSSSVITTGIDNSGNPWTSYRRTSSYYMIPTVNKGITASSYIGNNYIIEDIGVGWTWFDSSGYQAFRKSDLPTTGYNLPTAYNNQSAYYFNTNDNMETNYILNSGATTYFSALNLRTLKSNNTITIGYWAKGNKNSHYQAPGHYYMYGNTRKTIVVVLDYSGYYGSDTWYDRRAPFTYSSCKISSYNGATSASATTSYQSNERQYSITVNLPLTSDDNWHYYSFVKSSNNKTMDWYVDGVKYAHVSGNNIYNMIAGLFTSGGDLQLLDFRIYSSDAGQYVPTEPYTT